MTERPQLAEPRAKYVYWPGTQTRAVLVGPRVLNRPHSITADAEIPTAEPRACCCARAATSAA